uniref:Uncharacterized protein n=1 Tax=Anguilla anguilla TaxID=7936 RepID=A0A0E9TSC5_ANGAN
MCVVLVRDGVCRYLLGNVRDVVCVCVCVCVCVVLVAVSRFPQSVCTPVRCR